MIQEDQNLEIHSEEMEDLLGEIPHWTIRWGISVVLLFLIVLLFLSWFIKYPDLIQGRSVLTTNKPPIKLISNSSGKIKKLFVTDTSNVKKGDFIAEIESQTSFKEIEFLNLLVKKVDLYLKNYNDTIFFSKTKVLGEVQNDYNDMIDYLNDYRELIRKDNYYFNSIENLKAQIINQNKLLVVSSNQNSLIKKEKIDSKERYNANQQLFEKGVISKMEWIREKEIYSNKLNEMESTKKQEIQSRISVTNYKKQLNDFQFQYNEQLRSKKQRINQSILNIKNYIKKWKQIYILTSPIRGKVSYLSNLKENQFINSGSALFTIIPNNQDYLISINIISDRFGKIRVGQKVRLKLDNYQHEDFGYLVGEVNKISLVPINNIYRVEASLTSGLTTSYNKQINYTPEMTGTAEIITDDLRLIERFVKKFKQLFDRI